MYLSKKLIAFHGIFEETTFRLTSSQNLSQLVPFVEHQELVPFVEDQELVSIKSQIKDKEVSIGTTHVCEALVILIRFVDEQFNIRQLVVRLKLLAKSLTGPSVDCMPLY